MPRQGLRLDSGPLALRINRNFGLASKNHPLIFQTKQRKIRSLRPEEEIYHSALEGNGSSQPPAPLQITAKTSPPFDVLPRTLTEQPQVQPGLKHLYLLPLVSDLERNKARLEM